MSKSEESLQVALALPSEERAALADRLLQSLDEDDQSEIDRLWVQEAEDRLAAYDRGELQAIPGEEVFASLKLRSDA